MEFKINLKNGDLIQTLTKDHPGLITSDVLLLLDIMNKKLDKHILIFFSSKPNIQKKNIENKNLKNDVWLIFRFDYNIVDKIQKLNLIVKKISKITEHKSFVFTDLAGYVPNTLDIDFINLEKFKFKENEPRVAILLKPNIVK